jgi:hypothetical protein
MLIKIHIKKPQNIRHPKEERILNASRGPKSPIKANPLE